MKRPLALFLLCFTLSSCSTASSWNLDGIEAGSSAFDSQRLSYIGPEGRQNLSFEMLRIGETVEAFLSLSQFRFDFSEVKAEIIIGDERLEESIPVFEGRMRLRLPQEALQKMIQGLQDGKKVSILVDRFEETLLPDNFSAIYSKFLGNGLFLKNFFKGPL